jgi:hypothetical protein
VDVDFDPPFLDFDKGTAEVLTSCALEPNKIEAALSGSLPVQERVDRSAAELITPVDVTGVVPDWLPEIPKATVLRMEESSVPVEVTGDVLVPPGCDPSVVTAASVVGVCCAQEVCRRTTVCEDWLKGRTVRPLENATDVFPPAEPSLCLTEVLVLPSLAAGVSEYAFDAVSSESMNVCDP